MVGACTTNAARRCPQVDACWKKKRGRPKTNWRKGTEIELGEMGLTREEAQLRRTRLDRTLLRLNLLFIDDKAGELSIHYDDIIKSLKIV